MKKQQRLTRDQRFQLDAQFEKTPALGDGFMPSGEHFILISLLNSFGIRPNGREEAMDIAASLLPAGWGDE